MNGIAWVVEVDWGYGKGYEPQVIQQSRAHARYCAKAWREDGKPARVRKYLRQPEVRP